MLSLSDRPWQPYDIAGTNGLFKLEATRSGIDKNKIINTTGEVPYITRSDTNNGVNMFVGDNQGHKYEQDCGNAITIGLDTQTCFYQPHAFYTGQNIQVLRSDQINNYSALFICTMLKQQIRKFSWGGNGATLGRLYRTKILLPVGSDGNPDYKFMEEYIKERESAKCSEYINFCRTSAQD